MSDVDVVLTPVSRPELGEIRVDDSVFAIGRSEPNFASYGPEIFNGLSRRHARLFREDGCVYLADLQSRNGTTVNDGAVGRAPCQLRDGDEICFGGVLSYRVTITPRSRPAVNLTLTLSLTPLASDSGLDTIVITKFPFLISKSDATFSQYNSSSDQRRALAYLSRRHAYMFETGGQAFIEDLGSRNGTFIDGRRLEGTAELLDGVEIAFGGRRFVYRVNIAKASSIEPAGNGTRRPLVELQPRPVIEHVPVAVPVPVPVALAERERSVAPPVEQGRTRFMAAPTSFLEIFCDADDRKEEGVREGSVVVAAESQELNIRRRPRGRVLLLLSELAALITSGAPDGKGRGWRRAAGVAGIVGLFVATASFWNAPERDLEKALAKSDYSRAAVLASQLLEKHPDDLALKRKATEAALRANVPGWLVKVEAHDFDDAQGVLTGMAKFGTADGELRPMIGELEWLGNLERVVSGRGGPDAPIRIYADEDTIEQLIERWNDDTDEHQRALDRIASYVPQFGEWYGVALTHLRRLQSESAVYLPVIKQVKSNIDTELARDNADLLQRTLKDTAEKYPALGGLDSVRQELALYLDIRREARARQSGRLFSLLRKARLSIPPFEESLRALTNSGRLPSPALLEDYDAATKAWKDGNSKEAFAGLQHMETGPWAEDAAAELERRRGVTARFASLQDSSGTTGFVDQLLAFRGSLDAEEDVYFMRATALDWDRQKEAVIARVQDAMNRARTSWEEYRRNGAIDATQRIENPISDQFRTRARLLAEASRYAQQGSVIYSQVDPSGITPWAAIRDEIEAEAHQQRGWLNDLSNVLDPQLLKAKLALLGEPNA